MADRPNLPTDDDDVDDTLEPPTEVPKLGDDTQDMEVVPGPDLPEGATDGGQ